MNDFRNSKSVRRLSKNFFLVTDDNTNESIVVSGKLRIATRIRKGGYIPKSGLLMAEQLIRMKIQGKALEIGTGETGILASCLSALGASCIIASDIDPQAIQWAQQASNRSQDISWINCDLFPDDLANETFHTIVSNPPQMPMPTPGHLHDYGGPDGRDYISRIIKKGGQLLHRDGKLLLLCFDFLGIEHDFGREPIINLAQSCGMQTRVIAKHQRMIRKGGKTEENVEWIKMMYPGYSFEKDIHGNLFHEILILEMTPYHSTG